MAKFQALPRKNGFGWGLFATERIRQGETIMSLPVSTLSFPDRYSIQVEPGVHVNCEGTPACLLNHSCSANAAVRGWKVVAFNCIQPQEEITIDYRRTEDKLAEPFDCSCCGNRME